MRAYVNYAALAAARLRSDALGPLDSIGHLLERGRYHGTVWLGEDRYGAFAIEVDAGGDGEQIEIDLAATGRGCADADATFRGGGQRGAPVFALFHNEGDGSGFRVQLTRDGAEDGAFDSAALMPGDYYILTPLRPGHWTIQTNGGAEGSIHVSPAEPGAEPRASRSGASIRTDGKCFEPSQARVVSGDGVVFEIVGRDVAIEVLLREEKAGPGPRKVGIRYPNRPEPAGDRTARSAQST